MSIMVPLTTRFFSDSQLPLMKRHAIARGYSWVETVPDDCPPDFLDFGEHLLGPVGKGTPRVIALDKSQPGGDGIQFFGEKGRLAALGEFLVADDVKPLWLCQHNMAVFGRQRICAEGAFWVLPGDDALVCLAPRIHKGLRYITSSSEPTDTKMAIQGATAFRLRALLNDALGVTGTEMGIFLRGAEDGWSEDLEEALRTTREIEWGMV